MFSRSGQSILEYTIIIGIVTMVLYYMGTSIKRGVQSLVKVTADQVGNQQNADQDFADIRQGFMQSSTSFRQEAKNKRIAELGYIPVSGSAVYTGNTAYNDSSSTTTKTITNGGFQETN